MEPSRQWQIYAPVIALGFTALAISSHFAEKARGARIVLALGCLSIATGFILFATGQGLLTMVASLAFYVVGFASMEPVLSAQVTRHAPSLVRGMAAGVFNTVQFFGVFLGGLLAGLALKLHLESAFFLTVAAAQLPWLLIA